MDNQPIYTYIGIASVLVVDVYELMTFALGLGARMVNLFGRILLPSYIVILFVASCIGIVLSFNLRREGYKMQGAIFGIIFLFLGTPPLNTYIARALEPIAQPLRMRIAANYIREHPQPAPPASHPPPSYQSPPPASTEESNCPPFVSATSTAWKTFRNEKEGYSYDYPENLATHYMRLNEPPCISVKPIDLNFLCKDQPQGELYSAPEEIKINNHSYCFQTFTEGATGHQYTTYTYISNRDDKQLSLRFIVGRPTSCTLFENPANPVPERDCNAEMQASFDPNALADRIFGTFKTFTP